MGCSNAKVATKADATVDGAADNKQPTLLGTTPDEKATNQTTAKEGAGKEAKEEGAGEEAKEDTRADITAQADPQVFPTTAPTQDTDEAEQQKQEDLGATVGPRPTVGDKVTVLDTKATRDFQQRHNQIYIGKVFLVEVDSKDKQPYRLSGCYPWFHPNDVQYAAETAQPVDEAKSREADQKAPITVSIETEAVEGRSRKGGCWC